MEKGISNHRSLRRKAGASHFFPGTILQHLRVLQNEAEGVLAALDGLVFVYNWQGRRGHDEGATT
jgi:hypothetical protein